MACNVVIPQALWCEPCADRPCCSSSSPFWSMSACGPSATHRHHQPASRFSAVFVGDVPWHGLGLGDVPRLLRPLLLPTLSLSAAPADGLDRGAAQAYGGGRSHEHATPWPRRGIRGLRHAARGRAHREEHGFREMEAYTPYAWRVLPEELGLTRTGVPLITLLGGMGGGLTGSGCSSVRTRALPAECRWAAFAFLAGFCADHL